MWVQPPRIGPVIIMLLSAVACLMPVQTGFAQSDAASQSSLAASPAPGSQDPKSHKRPRMGVGFKVSTFGLGGEFAVEVSHRSNVRGGFNAFSYSRGYDNSGIHYTGSLTLTSVEAHYDWFPFVKSFHISPGLMVYNDNHVSATASVPGGQTFTLSGTTYESEPSNPVSGTGSLDFNKVAPTIMVGFGNLVRHGRSPFSVTIEGGVAFTGSPKVALNLNGGVCAFNGTLCRSISSDPTVQSNVLAQQTKFNNDVAPFKYYPIISMTFGYRF